MKNIPVRHIANAVNERGLPTDFSIRKLEDLLYDKGMEQPLHRHSFFHILVSQATGGEHEIDFVPYPITNNSVFFTRPAQVHKLALKKQGAGYIMQFSTGFYSPTDKTTIQIFRKAVGTNYYILPAAQFKKVLSILSNIFQEYVAQELNYIQAIHAHLNLFFIELSKQTENATNTSSAHQLYMQERLEELNQLIAQHFAQHKQPAFYAQKMHLSPYQLNAVTKTTLDKTSSNVINDYILLEAKRRLLATTNQVNQIASELGYQDASYFTRFVKKHTGLSPDAFRQKLK